MSIFVVVCQRDNNIFDCNDTRVFDGLCWQKRQHSLFVDIVYGLDAEYYCAVFLDNQFTGNATIITSLVYNVGHLHVVGAVVGSITAGERSFFGV